MTDINRTACTFSRPALNANTLKFIAVLAMVLDHAATVFLADTAPAALFFHAVGQIAAPIMCFFVAEGYAHTSNLKKYLLRLFIAAVISHVPYALCFKFTVWEFWYVTGVLWGLFLGLLAVTLWKRLRAPVWVRLLLLGLCCLLCLPRKLELHRRAVDLRLCRLSGKSQKSNGRFSGSSRFCMFCSISSTALRCPCG